MPALYIGNIKSVVGHHCEIILHSDLKSMHITHDGRLYSVGQMGSFVIIPTAFDRVVGLVTETRLLEVIAGKEDDQTVLSDKKVLTVVLIGTIADGKFEKGIREFPLVNDDVLLASEKDYSAIFLDGVPTGCVEIGNVSGVEEYRVSIDINKFLSKPVAVVGTTGAGKSYAVARIIHLLSKYPNTRIVVLDLHGEYTSCFGDNAQVLSVESGFEIPYWLFNYQELQDLCIDRSEGEAPNQAVIFKQKVLEAKKASEIAEGLNLGDSFSIDSPIYFDFQTVYDAIKQLNEEMVPGSTSRPRQGDFYGRFNRFLIRLEARLSDYRYNFIFKPSRYTSSESLQAFLGDVLGRGEGAKKITVIDISGMPTDVVQAVVSLLCRVMFDFTFWNESRSKSPLLLVCEEAHNYAGRKEWTESRRTIERLAKEGRKYGLGLMVVSQRPAELSETVLSQCNNFVVLRLTNPKDQSYIRSLVTDQYEDMMEILPALRRGEALFLGDATTLPLRVTIDSFEDRSMEPSSHDVEFYDAWNEPSEIDLAHVINCWRKQRRKP